MASKYPHSCVEPYRAENARFTKFLGLPIAMVPCLHQNNIYIKKEALGMQSTKIYIIGLVQKGYKPLRGFKLPAFMYRHIVVLFEGSLYLDRLLGGADRERREYQVHLLLH